VIVIFFLGVQCSLLAVIIKEQPLITSDLFKY
jgi:hypothetical protein